MISIELFAHSRSHSRTHDLPKSHEQTYDPKYAISTRLSSINPLARFISRRILSHSCGTQKVAEKELRCPLGPRKDITANKAGKTEKAAEKADSVLSEEADSVDSEESPAG